MKYTRYRVIFIFGISTFIWMHSHTAFCQSVEALEQRVQKLEDYAETIQPTLVELSNNLNASIQEYTKGLESSLENYSRKLQLSIDQRLNYADRKTVILNPFSRSYQSIETHTGMFLIVIDRVEKIEGGVRLHVQIGNPNYADYQNFTLKFVWGEKWAGEHVISFNDWRQSLNGVEFGFQGKIEKGKWNTTTVDLVPAGEGQLGYLECEMSVSSVELGYN